MEAPKLTTFTQIPRPIIEPAQSSNNEAPIQRVQQTAIPIFNTAPRSVKRTVSAARLPEREQMFPTLPFQSSPASDSSLRNELQSPVRSQPPRDKRRRQVQEEWTKKSPLIIENEFYFNGKQLPLESIGTGNSHKVFKCLTNETLIVAEQQVSSDKIIIKILNRGNVVPGKEESVILGAVKAYEYLANNDVPLPKVYANPITFKDPDNESNGKLWIIEKMETAITGEGWKNVNSFETLSSGDKKILDWAKEWLTKMANSKQDLINDFRKRNVMLNEEGNPVVIDFSLPDTEEWNINYALGRYVVDWANGNKEIFQYLIQDFPENVRNTMVFE